MTLSDRIINICSTFVRDGLYVGMNIPAHKVANAREAFEIPEGVSILALLDTTLFGSASEGWAVTVSGIFGKDTASPRFYHNWKDVASQSPKLVNLGFFGGGVKIAIGDLLPHLHHNGSNVPPETLLQMLVSLREVIQLQEVTPPTNAVSGDWHLGFNDQAWGPIDVEEVKKIIWSEKIPAGDCLVWKEGYEEWLPLSSIPEFSDLFVSASKPPPLPKKPSILGRGPKKQVHPNTHFLSEIESAPPVAPLSRTSKMGNEIDLNNAPWASLISLPYINGEAARIILEKRRYRGGFNSIEEIGILLNLQPHMVEKLRDRVVFEPFRGPKVAGRNIDL